MSWLVQQVGADLEEAYWRPGNGAAFLDLVEQLTGQPLTADAWVGKLKESVASVVQQEEKDYQEAVQQGPKIKPGKQAYTMVIAGLFEASLLQSQQQQQLHGNFKAAFMGKLPAGCIVAEAGVQFAGRDEVNLC